MLSRTTRLEAVQFADDGTFLVRLQKCTTLDGEVLKEEWHRTAIPPGASVEKQMAIVNQHLATMGFDPVPAEQIATIVANAQRVHTPEVVAAYRQGAGD